MPLDRAHVTVASRVMLPTYVVFFGVLGVNYLMANDAALNAPALVFAANVMPLPAWGGLFVACSLMMTAALLMRRRVLYRFALRMCAVAMVFWAIVIAAASLQGEATPLAAVWSGFVAVACYASDRSLATREV